MAPTKIGHSLVGIVLAGLLAACSGGGGQDDPPTASPAEVSASVQPTEESPTLIPSVEETPSPEPTEPIAVYPERGRLRGVEIGEDGEIVGCDKDVATTELRLGGTVVANGSKVSALADDEGNVTITMEEEHPFTSAIVNGEEGANLPAPDEALEVVLAPADFGDIETVALCDGGM